MNHLRLLDAGQCHDFEEVLQWHCYLARYSPYAIADHVLFFPSALQRLGQLVQRCVHSQQADHKALMGGLDPCLVCIGAYVASAQLADTDQTVLDWLRAYVPVGCRFFLLSDIEDVDTRCYPDMSTCAVLQT